MRFSTPHTQLDVKVEFSGGKIRPTHFTWNNQTHTIQSVDFIHKAKHGSDMVIYFSVATKNTHYKLALNTHSLVWTLEELYDFTGSFAYNVNDTRNTSHRLR